MFLYLPLPEARENQGLVQEGKSPIARPERWERSYVDFGADLEFFK